MLLHPAIRIVCTCTCIFAFFLQLLFPFAAAWKIALAVGVFASSHRRTPPSGSHSNTNKRRAQLQQQATVRNQHRAAQQYTLTVSEANCESLASPHCASGRTPRPTRFGKRGRAHHDRVHHNNTTQRNATHSIVDIQYAAAQGIDAAGAPRVHALEWRRGWRLALRRLLRLAPQGRATRVDHGRARIRALMGRHRSASAAQGNLIRLSSQWTL